MDGDTSTTLLNRRPGRPSFREAEGEAAEEFAAVRETIALDKSSKHPLWRQIAEGLETSLRAGRLTPGARIPSEQSLAQMFDVSRPVIRNALAALAKRGLVVKVHRKGVFVGDPPPETGFITTNLAAYDDLVARGHKVATRTFDFRLAEPDPEEAAALHLEDGDMVVRVGRVFVMDGTPISYAEISFVAARVPGLHLEDIEGAPILQLIRDRYGRSLVRAERWFKAVIPPAEVAAAMEIDPVQPMIWIKSVAFEADDSPLEFYRAYYNSEAALIHLSVIG